MKKINASNLSKLIAILGMLYYMDAASLNSAIAGSAPAPVPPPSAPISALLNSVQNNNSPLPNQNFVTLPPTNNITFGNTPSFTFTTPNQPSNPNNPNSVNSALQNSVLNSPLPPQNPVTLAPPNNFVFGNNSNFTFQPNNPRDSGSVTSALLNTFQSNFLLPQVPTFQPPVNVPSFRLQLQQGIGR